VRNQTAGLLLSGVFCLVLGAAPAAAQDAAVWQKYVEDAKAAYQQKDYGRSEQLLGAALLEAAKFGPDDPRVAVTLHNQANLAAAQGKAAAAEPLYRRALALLQKARGDDHPQVAMARLGLADFLTGQGRTADAEPEYRRALECLEQALGAAHPIVASALDRYAAMLRRAERPAEAEPLEARARAIRARQAASARR
jgi:tetratricopeptide (TPR) repeat protein